MEQTTMWLSDHKMLTKINYITTKATQNCINHSWILKESCQQSPQLINDINKEGKMVKTQK